MPSLLPAIEYPPSASGYWGPVTSTLDWCEENYYASHYVAELVNSLTNLMFVYLGLRGLRNCVRYRHDVVFVVGFVAYLMIGIGSFAFHATLTFEMQMVDEIAMIYSTCVMAFAIFSHGQPMLTRVIVGVLVTSTAVFVTIYYFYLNDPVFHQIAFTVLTLMVVIRGVYLMELTLNPKWRKVIAAVQGRPERWTNGHGAVIRAKSDYEEQLRSDKKDLETLKGMYQLLGYGLFCAILGFVIWSLDRIYCSRIRSWRRDLGMPWGFLLEGHGWWHILTGIAGYINVVWNTWIRYGLYGRGDEIDVVWPSLVFSIPEVVKKDKPKRA